MTLFWIIGLPLLGALVNLASGPVRQSKGYVAWLANLASGGAFLAALASLAAYRAAGEPLELPLVRWGPLGGREFVLGLAGDPLSIWFALVVTGVGFLIHLYSVWYMAEDADFARYFAKLNYFIFAMSLLVLADNFALLVVGWGNVGFASYSLIGFWRERPAANAAAIKAFVTNAVGEAGLVLGAAALVGLTGGLRYSDVFAGIERAAEVAPGWVLAAALLLLVAAAAKSAQLPLHIWLPDAMQGPTSVSALIHAATMVTAGVYLTARAYPVFQAAPPAMWTLAWLGALSALIGSLVACAQWDIKRVLAYSTMSQIGYMILGVGIGAYGPALFHFMTQAFFKALLFLGAGVIIHHLAGEQDIRRMGGFGRRMPWLAAAFAVGLLALAGVPPFSGFFSKDEILAEALAQGRVWLFATGALASAATAYYVARLWVLVFVARPGRPMMAAPTAQGDSHGAHVGGAHGPDARGAHRPHGHSAPGWAMAVPVALLALLSFGGGWIGIPGLTSVPSTFLEPVFSRFALVREAVPVAAEAEPVAVEAVPGEVAGADRGLGETGFDWPAVGTVLGLAAVGLTAGWLGARRRIQTAAIDEDASPERGLLGRALYLDDAVQGVSVGPTVALSHWVGASAEPGLIDGAVNGLARLADAAHASIGRLQSGHLRRYGLGVLAGALALVAYYIVA